MWQNFARNAGTVLTIIQIHRKRIYLAGITIYAKAADSGNELWLGEENPCWLCCFSRFCIKSKVALDVKARVEAGPKL